MKVQIPDRDKVDVQITPTFIGKDYVVYEVWWQGGKSWHRVQGLKAKLNQPLTIKGAQIDEAIPADARLTRYPYPESETDNG